MKIGILTFHCAYNFGAMLQCYALQETLKIMGHKVNIINYRPNYLTSPKPKISFRTFKCKSPLRIYKNISYIIPALKAKYELYSSFEKDFYDLTKEINDPELLKSVCNKYDYIILGSDQIWNSRFNNKEMLWYGSFKEKSKLISYAASAGDPHFSKNEIEAISQYLNGFNRISVREQKLKDVFQPYIKQNIYKVLDPTLMAPGCIWESFQNLSIQEEKPYILIYQARKEERLFNIAEKISQEKGWNIITVDFYDNSLKRKKYHRIISPAEFVSYTRKAQCVLTTSFHGTVFSIINNTPFYTLKLDDGADGRNIELLSILKLENRLVNPDSEIKYSDIDFSICNQILEEKRKESQDFLKDSIL